MGCGDSAEEANTDLNVGVLIYFEAHGHAEQIRLLLEKSNKKYHNRRITDEEWVELQEKVPEKHLPIWEERGLMMNESTAILRYLGKKFGYYPTSNLSMAAKVDATIDFLNNFLEFFMKVSQERDMSLESQNKWRDNV